MAKINGISVKNLSSFTGRNGTYYCGDIFVGDTKVASWAEDSNNCIDDDLIMEGGYSEQKLRKVIQEKSDNKLTLESLMTELLLLNDYENHFKEAVAGPFRSIVVFETLDGRGTTIINSPECLDGMTESQIIEKYQWNYNHRSRSPFPNAPSPKVRIYSSFSDFEIGTKISLGDLKQRNM